MPNNPEIIILNPGTTGSLLDTGDMKIVTSTHPEVQPEISEARAKEIFGENFFGPQEISQLLDIEIDRSNLPKIRVSEAELQRAHDLGQQLILRVGRNNNLVPLTMQRLSSHVESLLNINNRRKRKDIIDPAIHWHPDEPFFNDHQPRLGWALVTSDILPDSVGKDYLEQTQVLADYIRNQVYADINLPDEFAEAYKEFEIQKDGLRTLVDAPDVLEQRKASQRLCSLKLTQLVRPTPVEALYDFLICLQSSQHPLMLEDKLTWTSVFASEQRIVGIGDYRNGGLSIGRLMPRSYYYGAICSRRLYT